MKITAVRVYQAGPPLTEGRHNCSNDNSIQTFDATIFEVSIDEGFVGFGQHRALGASYLPAYVPCVRPGIQEIGPKLLGMDRLDLDVINKRMDVPM
jgi:cis-L-3-hydroxyproline dehydratase